jgi:molybdenum cofactor synthesis domain-containing protein
VDGAGVTAGQAAGAGVAGVKVAVITCSNRSARGERADDSGRLLADELGAAGFDVVGKEVVPDEVMAIRASVLAAVGAGARAVLTTGGTGLTPTDVTPEAVAPLFDRPVPGIAEALRAESRDRVPAAVLSRGVAGVIGSALVVTLPGSPGGVRDGLAVLLPVLGHAIEQLGGGDHRPGGGV